MTTFKAILPAKEVEIIVLESSIWINGTVIDKEYFEDYCKNNGIILLEQRSNTQQTVTTAKKILNGDNND